MAVLDGERELILDEYSLELRITKRGALINHLLRQREVTHLTVNLPVGISNLKMILVRDGLGGHGLNCPLLRSGSRIELGIH